jgi:hypothetical protein
VSGATEPKAAFIEASAWQSSLERAEAIVAAHPEITGGDSGAR